jgi:serine/threonine protein kinase
MGLARLSPATEDETTTGVTQEGVVVGTVDFLAPEQAVNASGVDIRADLYGLGCTFFYLLTGRVPFSGNSAVEKLLKHRGDEPPRVEQLRPEVTPALGSVVSKLMAKRPEDRYQTPAEVVLAISALAAARELVREVPPMAPSALGASDGGAVPLAIPVTGPIAMTGEPPPAAIPILSVPAQEPASPWEAITAPPALPYSGRSSSRDQSKLVGLAIGVSVLAGLLLFLIYVLLKVALRH